MLSAVGLEGWRLLIALTGVALTVAGLGYTVGRNRREDARRREALKPELEVSTEERAVLSSPQGASCVLGPRGAGAEGVFEVSLTNPSGKERPVRPVAMDLVPHEGGRLSLSGVDGDRELGEEIAPGDRARFWLPLDYLAWVLAELGNSGDAVGMQIEVRDALGNVHAGEAVVDAAWWSPPAPAPRRGDHCQTGEEVVFEFPLEHREEVEEILAIYEYQEGKGSQDIYLYGDVSPEAEHAGNALSWVTLSGNIPLNCSAGKYERIFFSVSYPMRGAVDLDERLAPKTIEVILRTEAEPAAETEGER